MKKKFQKGTILLAVLLLLSTIISVGVMAENNTAENMGLVTEKNQIVSNAEEHVATDGIAENGFQNEEVQESIEASSSEVFIEVTISTTNNLIGAINKKMIDMNISDYKDITSLKINAGAGVPIGYKDGEFIKEKLINLKKIDMTGVMEVTLPNYLFYGCEKLEELLLPYGAKVSDSMCYRCISLKSIDLKHADSTIESNAFLSCLSLKKVILPENAILKYRAFTGCRLLDDINWEAIKSTYNEGFNACAFDFTQGYPLAAWNDSNVVNINDHQIPKLYFSLAQTDYQINAGDSFIIPTPLFKTKNGTNYSDLEKYKVPYSAWLDQNTNYTQKMAYSTTIKLNGKVVNSFDTSIPGNYEITYSLLNTSTYADTYSLACNVTVKPVFSVSSFTADKNSGQGINTNINLTATAGNGMIPYQYKFYYKSGSETKVLQDFATTNTTIFKPTVAGDYTLFVEVKDGTGKIASESMVMKILDEGNSESKLLSFLGQDPAGNYYQYSVTDFNNSYLAYQINPSLALAKMYQQFLDSKCRVVSLEDQAKGYMDYNAAESASLMAQIKGEAFDLNAYFARNDAQRYEQIVNNLRIVDKDGNIQSGPNATVRFYSSLVPGTKIVVVKLDTITPSDYTVTYNGVVLIYDTLLAGFKGSVTMDVSETLIPVVFETH